MMLRKCLCLCLALLALGGTGAFAQEADLAGYTAISTPEQLKNVMNDPSGLYYLANDLDLSGQNWVPLGDNKQKFTGVLDGRGHQIRGMKIQLEEGETVYAGLFGYSAGQVKNLHLLSYEITLKDCAIAYAGGIAGAGSGSVEGCSAVGKITVTNQKISLKAGGLTGRLYDGNISSCYVAAAISAAGSGLTAGGVVGQSSGVIMQCASASGLVLEGKTNTFAGGVAGVSQGSVSDCYFKGAMAVRGGKDGYAGGIAGQNQGRISTAASWGRVQLLAGGAAHTGGIAGESGQGQVEQCVFVSEEEGGISQEALRLTESFSGFDFNGIWMMEETAPQLRVFAQPDVWPQGLLDVEIKVGQLPVQSPSGPVEFPIGEPQGSLLGNGGQNGQGTEQQNDGGGVPPWLIWLLGGVAAAAAIAIGVLVVYDVRKRKQREKS